MREFINCFSACILLLLLVPIVSCSDFMQWFDKEKPQCKLSSLPKEIQTEKIKIMGGATDNFYVKSVWFSMQITNEKFGKVRGTNEWTTNVINISNGIYQIRVFAIDIAGNTSITDRCELRVNRLIVTQNLVNEGEIAFTYQPLMNELIDSIYVAGDFTAWNSGKVKMEKVSSNKYQCVIELDSGAYRYQYIVNGMVVLEMESIESKITREARIICER